MKNLLTSVFLVLILGHSAIAQSGASTIAVGGKLTEGQRIYSPNKTHYLAMQADGNLCIYTSSDRFVWCSMVTKGSGSYLTMQVDGNLVVNDRNNQAAWSTETMAYFDPKYGTSDWKPVRAALEDDGTLGLYTAANRRVWSNAAGKINTDAAMASATESLPVEGYTGPTVKRQLNIVLPFSKNAQNVEVEIADDGKVIYQSDMVLGDVGDFSGKGTPSNDASSTNDQSRRWPNSTIPYVLSARHPKRDLILAGIKEVHDKTNLCVVPRTNEKDYVEFVSKSGNWSTLGKSWKGGSQEISIDKASMGTVAHEILHAAGFYHAQSRGDRDTYVTINSGNIQAGKEHNFKKQGKESNIGTYDFTSIMHYPAKAFSKNGRNTIDLKNDRGNEIMVMGQRAGLSAGDIAAVSTLYVPGSCKPAGAGLVASNTGNPPPTVATTTTNPTPTRPTSTEPNPSMRTRPTSTEPNPSMRTRPTGTATTNPGRTRPTGTGATPISDGKKAVPIPAFTPSATQLDNLALLPTAKTWQSYGDNTQFSNSQKAVDGNKNSAYSEGPNNSVSKTPPSLTPAWQIDLGQVAEVDHIVIWNSSEAPNLAGRSFYVTTGAEEIHTRPYTEPLAPDNPGFDSDVFGRDDASGRVESLGPYRWEADKISFAIPINRNARKIRISLQKEGVEMTPLSLTEVEVFGKPYTGRRR